MSDAMRCGLCGEEMRYNVPRLGPDGGFCHAATGSLTCKPMRLPARGEQVPQTVESLQAIMAADAVLMEKQGKEIMELKAKLNQAQQKDVSEIKPVAWLHNHRQDSDVVTDSVKHVWGKVAVGSLAAYSIPLYRDPEGIIDTLQSRLTASEAECTRLRDERRWIPVSARLPEDGVSVLITDGVESIGHARHRTSWWQIVASNDEVSESDVTHWMPLPPPPPQQSAPKE